jgi:hydrophobe/amphiphile efflux-1 (HAE1) family protein
MKLSELSIRRPVFAWMLMAFFILFGTLSFFKTGVGLLPDVDSAVISISFSLTGAAPSVMESQIVDPVEDALMQIEGVKTVTSNSKQSSASISVEFEVNKNIDVAIMEVQSKIASIIKNLPSNMDPPVIKKTNPEDQPIMWIVLSSKGKSTSLELMDYGKNELFDHFANIPGVADIILGGYIDHQLRIYPSIQKMNLYELTMADIIKSIQAEHREMPAGIIADEKKNIPIRLMGEAKSVADFENLPISIRGGKANFRPVTLKSVAKVEDSLADVRRLSRYNGKTAIGLGILKQHGSNSVQISKDIREKLSVVKKLLPADYNLDVRVDSTKNISDSVHEMLFTLLLSAILTSIVCFLFLGSLSSTFNVLLAIPTSIIGAVIGIYFFGFTLNTFTILGLSLAIGIVVDDAIMMLENIMRYVEMGYSKVKASLLGAEEITFAAVAATIAVVAIFLPVIFMKGLIGRFFFQFGVTVTIAVLLSLLEAVTITPMRTSEFISAPKDNSLNRFLDKVFLKLMDSYRSLLKLALKFRYFTIITAILLFIASIFLIKKIPSEMVPAQDQSQFLLRLKAPVGASLELTNQKFLEAESSLSKIPEISGYYASIGGFGGDQINEGVIMVSLVEKSDRKKSQKIIMDELRDFFKGKIKGLQVIVQDLSLRGFSSSRGFPVEFNITGPNWDELLNYSDKFIEELNQSGLIIEANSDIRKGMKEIHLYPNREKAALHGVSIKSLSDIINAMIGGVTLGATTKYPKDGHRYDINVRLLSSERSTPEDLSKIKVRNNRGELVSIKDLVDIKEENTLQNISRRDRQRSIGVYANLVKGHSQQEGIKYVIKRAETFFPKGIKVIPSGGAQSFKESFDSLFFALFLGIIVSYMVLSSQFNSFIHPISILMALPFSITGAILGLLAFNQSLNIFSFIGIILLMGIAKKNSILLVEFTNHHRQNRPNDLNSIHDAIIEACPVRLRPILMTSLATIAGAIPGALALGPGAETRIPMSISIIWGVVISTGFTLIVVPCFYSVLSVLEKRATKGVV